MSDNNIESLVHYTKEYKTIEKILLNGFRYSYCEEKFIIPSLWIPMICFCNIPFEFTKKHREEYGSYAIGLNKENLLNKEKRFLNPVIYCHSEWLKTGLSSLNKEYNAIMNEIAVSIEPTNCPNCCVVTNGHSALIAAKHSEALITRELSYSILGFTKPYADILENGNLKENYLENEWRFVIPSGSKAISGGKINWLDENQYLEWLKHNQILKVYQYFDIEDITMLIVTTDTEKSLLTDFIIKSDSLMQKPINNEQKRTLLSQIVSYQ